MGGRIPYHLSKGELRLSLRFVNPSHAEAQRVLQDLETVPADVETESAIREFDVDSTFYGVYFAESHPEQFPPNWDNDLPKSQVVLIDSVINTFRGVKTRWEQRGEPLNYYKEPQPKLIGEAFGQIQWQQAVPAVAGEMMSSLVRKHALPNANHRTAVAFLRTYLQSMSKDPDTEFEAAGNYQGDWHEWAKEYILESKRLLLLRRKTNLLKYAKELGVETIHRQSGVELDLKALDFEQQNLREIAEEAHRNRCIQFSIELIERSGHDYLIEEIDDGRSAFVARLK